MKNIVFKYGILCGSIPITVMVLGILFGGEHMEGSLMLGWTLIILSSAFIFLGIKKYRDNNNDGVISFGKAFQVGFSLHLLRL